MKHAARTVLVVAASAIVSAHAVADWQAILLEPANASQSRCFGASNGVQCGYSNFHGQGSATLWTGSAESVIDLSLGQSNWISSAANSISGDQVVLSALTTNMTRAILYSQSAQTFTDLTPPGYSSAAMQGCYAGSNSQVGSGQQMMGAMLLWHGTTQSAVNLTPPGWVSSAAAGCAGDMQVGNGMAGFMGMGRAFVTYGTPESYVDITPADSVSAGVAGCDLDSQVGSVLWPSVMQGHACIWHGTPESCVDINPSFAAASAAKACWNGTQVGSYVSLSGGFGKAVVWHGTAKSAEDLHQAVVDQLGPQFIQTETTGIDDVTGDIVGVAYTTDGMFMIPHAVMWTWTVDCPADLDGDGTVGGADLAILLGEWGVCSFGLSCPSDLTGDLMVGADDLAIMLGAWGGC